MVVGLEELFWCLWNARHFAVMGTKKCKRYTRCKDLIDWSLYLPRRKLPSPDCISSTLERQRTQENKKYLLEWVLLWMYTKVKVREQKETLCPKEKFAFHLRTKDIFPYLLTKQQQKKPFWTRKMQSKFILSIILACHFIEWHTEYSGSKMLFCVLWWWRNWQLRPAACGYDCQTSFNEFHMNIWVQYLGFKEEMLPQLHY